MLALLLGKLLNLSGGKKSDNKDKIGIRAPALHTVD